MKKLRAWAKPWGGHHIPLALLILAALYFCPPEFRIPLGNALFWFGKEYAEARERALRATDGEASLLDTFKPKYWEHWDWITPSIVGVPGAWL